MQANNSSGESMSPLQYRSSRSSIRRFLRMGLIGDIGHISCEDTSNTQNFARHAASQLVELASLLDLQPVSVIARTVPQGSASAMQVFCSIGDKKAIHYGIVARNESNEHTLWLEGSKGSLRTNGRTVWWRKRGWPVFVPVSLPFSLTSAGNRSAELVLNVEAALSTSMEQNVEVNVGSNDATIS